MANRAGARVQASTIPTSSDIDDLIASAGPLAAPDNLGNFPAEKPAAPPAESTPSEEVEAAPPSVPEPEAVTDDEPDEPAAPPADWEARLANLERENQFLRARVERPAPPATPPPPTDPVQVLQQYLPYTVTEQDMQTILSDPVKGAEYLTNIMRAAALGGASMAAQVSTSQLNAKLAEQTRNTSLRDQFWAANPDLAPYHEVVQTRANEVFAEGGRNNQQYVEEVGRRTRAQLREWGIRLDAAPSGANPRAPGRIRPARAEGVSGGSRGNGSTKLSAFERDVFQLMNAR